MAHAVVVCEDAAVALGFAEGCSLGMGGAGLGGRGWVRAGRGEVAERGQLDIGSMARVPGHPSLTSGSVEREENIFKGKIHSTQATSGFKLARFVLLLENN